MSLEFNSILVSPIFKAIVSNPNQNLDADYFALIIIDNNFNRYELLLSKEINNLAQLEEDIEKTALNAWELCWQNSLKYLCADDDSYSRNPICEILSESLQCRKVLMVPYELANIGGGFLVWCWQTQPPDFEKSFIENATHIVKQVSMSLMLVFKERKSQELNAKLAALLDLSTSIYSSLNYTDVLEKAVNLSMKIVGADGGTIFTLDKKTDLLMPLITIDTEYEDKISQITLNIGEGITGLAAKTGKGIISNHSETDSRSYHVPGTPEDEPESLISVPLTWSGEVLGAITLRSTKCKQFVRDDLDILTIFARQVADAIKNAKLYESLDKAYKELSNTQEQLIMTEKLRALGEMAGGVAHDFNNVLGTVLGRTQLLMSEIDNSRWLEQLKQIEEVSIKGADTVQKLQNFTRVYSTSQLEQVELNEVVEDAIKLTKPRWKDESQHKEIIIDLTFKHGKLMPIMGNRADLVEAISNIILNGVDAITEKGVIQIETFMQDDRAVVKISDNGAGMSEKTLNRVFFPFYTTKGNQGTGMGLAVVYGIISRHKGEIDVASKVNRGTVFNISFKTIEELQTKTKVEDTREAISDIKANVLVIDDDDNILDVLGDILEFLGHTATKASTGEEGVEYFKTKDFDIVLTDLGMPGISGWEVTRICKSLKPEVPVVMISGWGNQITDEMVAESKLDEVIAKPFEMNKIKNIIQRALAKK